MSRYTNLPSAHQIISAARRASIAARADRLRQHAAEMAARRRHEKGEDMLPGLQPVTMCPMGCGCDELGDCPMLGVYPT